MPGPAVRAYLYFTPHNSLHFLQMRKMCGGTITSKCPCDDVPALSGRHSWGPTTALGMSSSASTHRCTQHGDPQARPQGSTLRSRADGALLPREQSCSCFQLFWLLPFSSIAVASILVYDLSRCPFPLHPLPTGNPGLLGFCVLSLVQGPQ